MLLPSTPCGKLSKKKASVRQKQQAFLFNTGRGEKREHMHKIH
jgi:hypothetical protein